MSDKLKLIERIRNRSSRKTMILVHLIMLCICASFICLMAVQIHHCKEVMDSTGMTLNEIATIDYKSSYTEYEVKGIASFHKASRVLILLSCVLGAWVVWPFNIKHDREILKLIDNENVESDPHSKAEKSTGAQD